MSQSKPQEDVVLTSFVESDSVPFGYNISLAGKSSYLDEPVSALDPDKTISGTSLEGDIPHVLGIESILYTTLPDGSVAADLILNIEGRYEDVEIRVSLGSSL